MFLKHQIHSPLILLTDNQFCWHNKMFPSDLIIKYGVNNLMTSCCYGNASKASTWKQTDKQPHLHVLAGLDKLPHQAFQLTGPLD